MHGPAPDLPSRTGMHFLMPSAQYRTISRCSKRQTNSPSFSPRGFSRNCKEESTMSHEQLDAETRGVFVKLLAAADLGPEIEGMAGRQLRMRMVTIYRARRRLRPDSRPQGPARRRLPFRGHDQRPSGCRRHGLRAGRGLAGGQEHHALARKPGDGAGGGDLDRSRQTNLRSGDASSTETSGK